MRSMTIGLRFGRHRRHLLAAAALACGSLLLLALPGRAGAQSLQELYDAARGFDAAYLGARNNYAAAEFREQQAEGLARPNLSATAAVTTGRTDYPVLGTVNSSGVSGALNGRYPLYNRANDATIAQARRQLVSSQADLDTAEQDLIVRVAQAYFDVLNAQDTLGTTRTSKAAITEQLASAKRNFEVGTATITDTREAQARFDLATAQEIAADNDLLTRRIALDTLVGKSGIVPKPLPTPVVLPPPLPANAEEWVTAADQQHPAIRRARVAVEVAQLETGKARAGEYPTLDAVATVSGNNARGRAVSLPGTTAGASVGVQMNWPLYTGGQVQNRIRETLALEDAARSNLEAARRLVAGNTRTAYFGLISGQAQVKALEAAESSTKLALEATQLGYRVGVRVNLDVLNAQTQLFTTQRDLAQARYTVLLGGLRLRQASGQLAAADIDTVNRLLAR